MRVVVQRVTSASVTIGGAIHSQIGRGLLILVGIEDRDGAEDVEYLCNKISNLRVFDDENGVMNNPITAVPGAQLLVVSQFTLMASTKKGNRPSYIRASRPEVAVPLYNSFVDILEKTACLPVATGVFGADMKVALVNDGPVTIIMDSHERDF